MITRGDVSLDVEDNRGPDDWPLLSDIATDFLRYSVHLPLDPKVIFQKHPRNIPPFIINNLYWTPSKMTGGQEGTNQTKQ